MVAFLKGTSRERQSRTVWRMFDKHRQRAHSGKQHSTGRKEREKDKPEGWFYDRVFTRVINSGGGGQVCTELSVT